MKTKYTRVREDQTQDANYTHITYDLWIQDERWLAKVAQRTHSLSRDQNIMYHHHQYGPTYFLALLLAESIRGSKLSGVYFSRYPRFWCILGSAFEEKDEDEDGDEIGLVGARLPPVCIYACMHFA